MKVYYGKNFWESGEARTEMKEIRLNKAFEWEDISGFIPSFYVCDEGIAIDFCIRISNWLVQDFWNQWQAKLGEALSEDEREQIVKTNPLTTDFTVSVSVNDIPLENDFGCGAAYTKVFQNNMKDSLEEQLFLEYGCDENDSWCFKRHMCRWSEMPQKIETITIDFQAEHKPLECDVVEVGLNDMGKEFEVVHPLSGVNYRLYVDEVKQQEIAEDIVRDLSKHHRGDALEYPIHYLTVSYHIQPSLPENEFVLQSAGKGEKPRGQGSKQAANISMIGGADGPVSIFIAGKREKGQGRIGITSMYFNPIEREFWRPVFLVKERKDMRLTISV